MLNEYRAYLRDNPHGYWFKAKRYGWGWVPATWQGWLVLALYIAIVVANFLRIDASSHSVSDTLINFVPQTILLMLVLIGICYITGERLASPWGRSNRER
jgi:amino acid transporter